MAADIRAWLADPESNHGWLILTETENTIRTARRFASREDANNSPRLVIEYSVPAASDPPRLMSVVSSRDRIGIRFRLEPLSQVILEATDILSASQWTVLTNFSSALRPADFTSSDAANSPQRFYRLRVVGD